jgi:hypothetical protein
MGKLVRRLQEGYQPVAEWSPDDPASLEHARRRFQEELDAGYTAVLADGDENDPITELPPDAEMVVLTVPMGGG